MNAISIDTLKLRVPPINYTAPPVCEVILSGSGFPSIELDAFGGPIPGPGPVLPPDYPDNPFFSFPPTDPVPLCVTIAQQVGEGRFIVVDECIPTINCSPNICVPPPSEGCFQLQTITDLGVSEWSNTVCVVGPEVTTLAATNVT